MKMANAVQLLAERTPGKEAQAIEGFARALRQVGLFPRCWLIESYTVVLL